MKQKSHAVKEKSGFTLVEMVVTLSIFSILVAIAIPVFTSWLPGYNLKSAARDVFSNLQLAKLDAIKRSNLCTITINISDNTYTIGLIGGDKKIDLADYDRNVKIKNTSDNSITFNSRGMLVDIADRKIEVTNTQNITTWSVMVTRVGTISITKL
jgi:prepilin-type N-terminal cleavage/methylation domain-containing protein